MLVGKKAISSLQGDYPQKFQPMTPLVRLVSLPIKYETIPRYGLFEYLTGKGKAESYSNNHLVKPLMTVNSK
jgi:hypothetical protein